MTASIFSSVKPLAFKRTGVDAGRLVHVAVTGGIGLDFGNLAFRIAERAQGFRHRLIDDLEIAATGQLLELDQRKVRLDAGGVAIHNQADGAGRGEQRLPAHCDSRAWSRAPKPCPRRRGHGRSLPVPGNPRQSERHRIDRQLFIALRFAMGGAAMVAHDAQHVVAALRA